MSEDSASSAEYTAALEATRKYGEPPVGFVKVVSGDVAPSWGKNLIKQNNLLIELVSHLSQEVAYLKRELRLIKVEKTAAPAEASAVISEELVAKLENLTITKGEKKKESRGKGILVYKDPYVIHAEEVAKLKKKYP